MIKVLKATVSIDCISADDYVKDYVKSQVIVMWKRNCKPPKRTL